MKYKAVVYHPYNKKNLGFTKNNFFSIFDKIPQVYCTYVDYHNEFYKEIADADFIVALNPNKDIYQHTRKLKAIFTCMAAKDSIPISGDNTVSYYYGSFHGKLISETLLSSIMYFNQNFNLLNKNKQNKLWGNNEIFGKRQQLYKQSVAIFGYGSIGRYCAKYLSMLNIKVYAIQRTHKNGNCPISGAEYVNISDVINILPKVNHVVSMLPESEGTNDIFNHNFFKTMNKNSFFYNFGRGNSVNENDLILSLSNEEIAGALIDVCKNEPLSENSLLWDTEKLLITPHISTYYDSYFEHYAIEFSEQMLREIKKY